MGQNNVSTTVTGELNTTELDAQLKNESFYEDYRVVKYIDESSQWATGRTETINMETLREDCAFYMALDLAPLVLASLVVNETETVVAADDEPAATNATNGTNTSNATDPG